MRVERSKNWKTSDQFREQIMLVEMKVEKVVIQRGFVVWRVEERKNSEKCRGGGRRASLGKDNKIMNNDWGNFLGGWWFRNCLPKQGS